MRSRVLIVSPNRRWNHAESLQRNSPDDVEIVLETSPPWATLGEFDISYRLDCPAYTRSDAAQIAERGIYIKHLVEYPYLKTNKLVDVRTMVDGVVVVHKTAWQRRQRWENYYWIAPTVDTEVFRPTVPICERPHTVLYASPQQGDTYWETVWPLQRELFHHGYRLKLVERPTVSDLNDSVFYLLTEETDVFGALEAAACGTIVLSCGYVPDWLEHRKNGWECRGTIDGVLDAVSAAHMRREELSAAAVKAAEGFTGLLQYHYNLFRKLPTEEVRTFSWEKIHADTV